VADLSSVVLLFSLGAAALRGGGTLALSGNGSKWRPPGLQSGLM
jgi:hypothetical protein